MLQFRYGERSILECPPEITRRLTLAGGRNPYGGPNYRLEWGWRHMEWVNGARPEFDESGNFLREIVRIGKEPSTHHTCKKNVCYLEDWEGKRVWELYPGHQYERWNFLVWKPAEWFGSLDSWYGISTGFESAEFVAHIGPFPQRGSYEISHTIETSRGEFVGLSPRLVERLLEMVKVTHARTRQQIRDQVKAQMAAEKKETRHKIDEILGEAADVNPNLVMGYRPPGQNAILHEKAAPEPTVGHIPFADHQITRARIAPPAA